MHVARAPQFAAYRPKIVPRRILPHTLREIFVLGLPITFTQILNGAMFTVAAVMTGVLGAEVLAAQQILYAVIYFALSASIALSDAARVRVAYGIGIRSVAAARQSANITFVLAAIMSALAAATLWLIPEAIVGIFLNTADAANAGVMLIALSLSLYAAVFQALDGILIVVANAIRGLRDTKSPLYISMAGYGLVGLGCGTLLCFGFDLGAEGLWQGLVLGPLVAIILMAMRFQLRMREAEAKFSTG